MGGAPHSIDTLVVDNTYMLQQLRLYSFFFFFFFWFFFFVGEGDRIFIVLLHKNYTRLPLPNI